MVSRFALAKRGNQLLVLPWQNIQLKLALVLFREVFATISEPQFSARPIALFVVAKPLDTVLPWAKRYTN
jgi:hypothetical protein